MEVLNSDKFYGNLRNNSAGLFRGGFTQDQVDGINEVLAECGRVGVSLTQAAYILATAAGETGGKMQPQHENLNYTQKRIPQVFSKSRRNGVTIAKLAGNPELLGNTVYGGAYGSARLGNTEKGDGWRFRGTGMGQITGRYNFTKWSEKMGIDFLRYPEKLMELPISVKALVRPMVEGWATGLRLDTFVNATKTDYYNARKVWNGTFDAEKYSGYARAFEAALEAGGWGIADKQTRPTARPVIDDEYIDPTPAPIGGFWAFILGLLK